VLKLFEGSRWPDPAAALAAWKQATPNPGLLGKPLEAIIALFNPDMVREWRILDDAELQLDLDPADGSLKWFAIVPRDDGTAAAAITASRLTYPDEQPLVGDGAATPVARLGRSGVPVACQVGPTLILGNSRDQLRRALHAIRPASAQGDRGATAPSHRAQEGVGPHGAMIPPPDSGWAFRLAPARLTTPRAGSIGLRRAVELIHAIGCRGLDGFLALQDGTLALEVTTTFEARRTPAHAGSGPAVVDPTWLACLPSSGVMAFVALAIDPDPSTWDRAFALADRVERVDPARAAVAPLRTRLNLLAAAAGLKPEADLWPHLRGISACLLRDPDRPGLPDGAVLMLHLDQESSAERLVQQAGPRLGSLWPAPIRGTDPRPTRPDQERRAVASPGEPKRMGRVLGRDLTLWRRDRDLFLAWGDGALVASLRSKPAAGRSMAAACAGWAADGRGMPDRIGAFWPGRLGSPRGGPALSTPALRVLTDDPPVIWWGWSTAAEAHDSVRWRDLPRRVRRFLEAVPIDRAPGSP
jgi:hypothetical protein